jgi:hypothetical protein
MAPKAKKTAVPATIPTDDISADLAALDIPGVTGKSSELMDPDPGIDTPSTRVPTEDTETGDEGPEDVSRAPAMAPAVKAAPATKKTAPAIPYFEVTVEGQYYAFDDATKRKTLVSYKESFNLPQYDAALSIIKSKLLTPRLANKDINFKGVRTHQIVNMVPKNGAKMPARQDIRAMSEKQIRAMLSAQNITEIDPDVYPDLNSLRASVIDYMTSGPDGFARREAKRVEKYQAQNALDALNPQ